ncbi:hypothetical protein [Sphingomonas kyungheensis]|uniref:Cell envelope biogenesis protein TolA n=1 Tax=Sphingomonas kyungheensis TaxID=1069987 RepID=A0ABU8H0Z8_9SPHN
MAKLKVFRTPIGFHDAYVAATSRKAALKAWGSERDLFARGSAEEVTDPSLTAEPLAQPGVVIRRSRGSAAEQIAALPETPARPPRRATPEPAPATPSAKPKPRAIPPKPDRAALDAAEQALAEATDRQRGEARALRAEEATLAKRRRAMEREHEDEQQALAAAKEGAADAYDRAMRLWRAASR